MKDYTSLIQRIEKEAETKPLEDILSKLTQEEKNLLGMWKIDYELNKVINKVLKG